MQERKPSSLVLIIAVAGLLGYALTLRAQSGGSASGRWEYRVLDTKDMIIHPAMTDGQIDEAKRVGITAARNLDSEFDRLGAEGWELVSFADRVAVFKRPRN
ncbi:MAG TPA: hypothetical protein PLU87_01645 [Sedimentisphaerales bacterium]|nr:hypothetical protein [Sedimentisphaerales bacterium]HRS09917.1 hypothetical protein [Sedimentisphaerales bacterium]HRV46433.1 hypothetical protein [Sedimentisphaerales bacterium]